jgi:Tfp pilus assembly protein PilX
MRREYTHNKQSGFVSIFTVLFFIILITVLVVGFLRLVGDEQRQAIDNDLTASALASAESGVEDAKRALLLYKQTGNATLKTAFAANQCDTLSNPGVAALLKANQGAQAAQSSLIQSYTCVTVDLNTDNYQNTAVKGKSELIPLDTAGQPFTSLKFQWHASTQDGVPANLAPGSRLPDVAGWQSQGYPAYMRLQVIGVPTGAFTLSALEARSKTVVLVPATGPGSAATVNLDGYDLRDPNNQALRQKSIPFAVQCNKASQPYVCSVNVTLSGQLASSANQRLYLRVTSIYADTHYDVSLLNGASVVQLNEVQPIVDSTGKANDVFRRVEARIRFSNPTLPEYALESADDICKDFVVTGDPADNTGTCVAP